MTDAIYPPPEDDAADPHGELTARLKAFSDNLRLRAAHRLNKPPQDVTHEELRRELLGPIKPEEAQFTHTDELKLRDQSVNRKDPAQLQAYLKLLEAEATTQAWCAQRLALLLEGQGDEATAAKWWRQAAKLGDPDAIDYVAQWLPPEKT